MPAVELAFDAGWHECLQSGAQQELSSAQKVQPAKTYPAVNSVLCMCRCHYLLYACRPALPTRRSPSGRLGLLVSTRQLHR